MPTPVYRVLISCPDACGLVAIVSNFIAENGGNIVEAHHFLDKTNSHFFMRNEIEANSLNITYEDFVKKFAVLAKKYQMQFSITSSEKLKRTLILGSNTSHCLNELLHKKAEGDLNADILGVLSNHNTIKDLSNFYKTNFEYFDLSKNADAINNKIIDYNPDLIILARYMQIIPANICKLFANKIINIHHSFLPSFKGGNPYKQAEQRGVKIIGATCHFVNEDLDDGAIIQQNIHRVSHNDNAESMKKIGQDIEKITLSQGVKLFLEDRIIVFNNKTIIFN
jgi:formyltetrahydrofolate deformylase